MRSTLGALRCFHRWVSPSRLPNPACLLPGNGLSANPVLRGDGQPHGEISNLLYDTVDVGEVLTLSLPYGDVVLDDAGRPVVFASAGIGIAPMAGMLSHLVTAGSGLSITLLHADEGAFSLRRQVVSGMLALRNAALHVWYEKQIQQPTGDQRAPGLNLADIDLPADAAYLHGRPDAVHAGPAQHADRVRRGTQGHPVRGVGPDLGQADFDRPHARNQRYSSVTPLPSTSCSP